MLLALLLRNVIGDHNKTLLCEVLLPCFLIFEGKSIPSLLFFLHSNTTIIIDDSLIKYISVPVRQFLTMCNLKGWNWKFMIEMQLHLKGHHSGRAASAKTANFLLHNLEFLLHEQVTKWQVDHSVIKKNTYEGFDARTDEIVAYISGQQKLSQFNCTLMTIWILTDYSHCSQFYRCPERAFPQFLRRSVIDWSMS